MIHLILAAALAGASPPSSEIAPARLSLRAALERAFVQAPAALRAQGKTAEAATLDADVADLWRRADTKITTSRL